MRAVGVDALGLVPPPQRMMVAWDPGARSDSEGHRASWAVVREIERVIPRIELLRPGLYAMAARGPARYYGTEAGAAAVLGDTLHDHGVDTVRIGVAHGVFAAEQAAYRAGEGGLRIVGPDREETAAFLAGLPIEVLGETPILPLLHRLGLHTLGDVSRVDPESFRERFGPEGNRALLLARGYDTPRPTIRQEPGEQRTITFEPGCERIDQVAFGCRAQAAEFVAALAGERHVCTAVSIEISDEAGAVSQRVWTHPRWFTHEEIVDRIRWQLQRATGADPGLGTPVIRVVIRPHHVDVIGHHEPQLWGDDADRRIHHVLSRLQGMLGHREVVTATVVGGRAPAERQVHIPWGQAEGRPVREASQPWPGRLPAPFPATVFQPPLPAGVRGRDGEAVSVAPRGAMSADPAVLTGAEVPGEHRIAGWAGPWPLNERWWDERRPETQYRFVFVDAAGTAWLAAYGDAQWRIEARYD